MKHALSFLFCLITTAGFSQNGIFDYKPSFQIKSNLLNLVAGKPAIAAEVFISHNYSIEGSYAKGKFYDVGNDYYAYEGFLLREKKILNKIKLGQVSPFVGVYVGSLDRSVRNDAEPLFFYFRAHPDKDFSANSIRGGGTFGLTYYLKNKLIFETQASLGYGKYFNFRANSTLNDVAYNGYADIQLGLSIGYSFGSKFQK